jgi:hypothetical protein
MTNHLNTIAADTRQAELHAAAARSRRARSASRPERDERPSRRRFQLRRRPAVA